MLFILKSSTYYSLIHQKQYFNLNEKMHSNNKSKFHYNDKNSIFLFQIKYYKCPCELDYFIGKLIS